MVILINIDIKCINGRFFLKRKHIFDQGGSLTFWGKVQHSYPVFSVNKTTLNIADVAIFLSVKHLSEDNINVGINCFVVAFFKANL